MDLARTTANWSATNGAMAEELAVAPFVVLRRRYAALTHEGALAFTAVVNVAGVRAHLVVR